MTSINTQAARQVNVAGTLGNASGGPQPQASPSYNGGQAVAPKALPDPRINTLARAFIEQDRKDAVKPYVPLTDDQWKRCVDRGEVEQAFKRAELAVSLMRNTPQNTQVQYGYPGKLIDILLDMRVVETHYANVARSIPNGTVPASGAYSNIYAWRTMIMSVFGIMKL